jgi:hypothetical protein
MKTKHFTLAIAIASLAILFTSCGGSKYANTEQLKSYVLMTSVDRDVVETFVNEYAQKLESGKIKDVFVPDAEIDYKVAEETIEVRNPWIEKAKLVILDGYKGYWFNYNYWSLNESEMESGYATKWVGDSWGAYGENNRNIYAYTKEFSGGASSDDSVCGITVIHAWIKFIKEKAKKLVKVYDCQYSKSDSTKSAKAYYIIYSIDKDYYVLVRLTEEKKTSRFEIETLARGESLIEIERKLEYYI